MKRRLSLGLTLLFTFVLTMTMAFYVSVNAGITPPGWVPGWCTDSEQDEGDCCWVGEVRGVWVFDGGRPSCHCTGLPNGTNPCKCFLQCDIPD